MRFFIINVLILIFTLLIALIGKCGLGHGAEVEMPARKSVTIACTCKAESIIDLFSRESERTKAIAWFKDHGVTRVYLETFRHGRFADEDLLQAVKRDFEAAGLDVQGAICPTNTKVWPLTACQSKIEEHELLKKVSERTAKLFDLIILDDFISTSCTCKLCTKLKADRSWGDARSEFQLELGRKYILEPGQAVNPNVQFMVKFPCWYEKYYQAGYDVLRDTELYGMSYIGTETREPDDPAGGRRPQTQASWIQGWANDFSQGHCGGAWFDPLGTKPETFVEQARQSVLGGAREILIHSYDYLGTDSPGIAVHGNGKVEYGMADAAAFQKEKDSLLLLANKLVDMQPRGILLAKQPNKDVAREASLNGFLPMLGLPVLPAASLKETPADILTLTSGSFDGLHERILDNCKIRKPTLITYNLLLELPNDVRETLGITDEWMNRDRPETFLEIVHDNLYVLGCGRDLWQLMDLPQETIDTVRGAMTAPFSLKLQAPTRVSFHLFTASNHQLQAVENFNNKPVRVTLTWLDGHNASELTQSFPNSDAVRVVTQNENSLQLELAPRSLAILESF
ncbi:MAG: hypothetical protein Q4G68_11075 [Planctomycetia bacterium]|nr:hypothetical protein [Planctomycetia bacterium]